MVTLREVDALNFDEIVSMKRESNMYVGSPEFVLAEAYVYRGDSAAFGIYSDEIPVGLVVIRDRPEEGYPYSFTGLFIADDFQRRGFGREAVEAIMQKFRAEGKRGEVEIQVHQDNLPAIKIYTRCGFRETGRAKWNAEFVVMRGEVLNL